MTGVVISSLPAASTLTGSEIVPIVQSGTTVRTTLAAMPYVPAGTGAVTTSVQAKLRETVSVFDFMTAAEIIAVQTNTWTTVTDVTTAIQAAIDASSAVYFPSGTYRSNTISFNGVNGKTLFGTGTIQSITNQAALVSIYNSSYDIVIDGLTFVGKLSGTIDRGFNLDTVYGIQIKNCTIKNFNEVGIVYGVTSATVKYRPITIEGNTITRCGSGILVTNGEYAEIRANKISECGTIWSANGPTIDNYGGNAGVIGDNSGWGIKGALGNCRVENNHIQQNFYGLLLDGSLGTNPDHSHILGNAINHNQAYGLYIANIVNCEQIIGNEVLSTVGPGVWPPTGTSISCILYNCTNISLIGNTIDGGAANVMRLDNTIRSKFVGNVFYSTANPTEATQCQDNLWIGNDFKSGSGVTHYASTTKYVDVGNITNNNCPQTIPLAVTFVNSWANQAGYQTAQYFSDSEGKVYVRGTVVQATIGLINTAIFNLPAGYRPSANFDVVCSTTTGTIAAVRVYTNGDVQQLSGSTTAFTMNFSFKP